jgi:hypothetical protein
VQRDRRDRDEVAREGERPPHVRLRHAGGARDRRGHDAGERALAEVPEQEPLQEALLRLVRPAEELRERLAPRGLGARTAQAADPLERGVDLADGEARLGRGRRQLAQLRVPDADLALGQPP